jgi:DeoR/GlpR family transcriptional regulator of sugar metabolism
MQIQRYYTAEMEEDLYYVYSMLNEKQRRHYIALEAKKLGLASLPYLSDLFGVDKKTILAGLADLEKKRP